MYFRVTSNIFPVTFCQYEFLISNKLLLNIYYRVNGGIAPCPPSFGCVTGLRGGVCK